MSYHKYPVIQFPGSSTAPLSSRAFILHVLLCARKRTKMETQSRKDATLASESLFMGFHPTNPLRTDANFSLAFIVDWAPRIFRTGVLGDVSWNETVAARVLTIFGSCWVMNVSVNCGQLCTQLVTLLLRETRGRCSKDIIQTFFFISNDTRLYGYFENSVQSQWRFTCPTHWTVICSLLGASDIGNRMDSELQRDSTSLCVDRWTFLKVLKT